MSEAPLYLAHKKAGSGKMSALCFPQRRLGREALGWVGNQGRGCTALLLRADADAVRSFFMGHGVAHPSGNCKKRVHPRRGEWNGCWNWTGTAMPSFPGQADGRRKTCLQTGNE